MACALVATVSCSGSDDTAKKVPSTPYRRALTQVEESLGRAKGICAVVEISDNIAELPAPTSRDEARSEVELVATWFDALAAVADDEKIEGAAQLRAATKRQTKDAEAAKYDPEKIGNWNGNISDPKAAAVMAQLRALAATDCGQPVATIPPDTTAAPTPS